MNINYLEIVSQVLLVIGLWKIFSKLGQKGWLALIPGYRMYRLGELSDRVREGRALILLEILEILIDVTARNLSFTDASGQVNRQLLIIALLLFFSWIAGIVYQLRIYSGLCRLFGKRKRWLFAFCFLEELTLLYWGFSPKFVPVEGLAQEAEGAGESTAVVASTGSGLNVNIRERSVRVLGRKRVLLKDIHLDIPKGHMVLLLGGSGAGKTTFVNAVTGYEKADAKVLLDDRDMYQEYDKMKFSVGFVPQQDLMRGHDTVALTLYDAASLRLPANVRGKEKYERIKQVLREFGLYSVRDSLVEKLSGGQRKRLSIAMEYISDPELFILDEPDSGLDGIVARGIFEKLRAIADENKIVIVITHTPDRVKDLFDDVIVLAKDSARTGRLAFFGSVKEAESFFEKDSMEGILKAINQSDEGGEGRANEFVEKYGELMREEIGDVKE